MLPSLPKGQFAVLGGVCVCVCRKQNEYLDLDSIVKLSTLEGMYTDK